MLICLLCSNSPMKRCTDAAVAHHQGQIWSPPHAQTWQPRRCCPRTPHRLACASRPCAPVQEGCAACATAPCTASRCMVGLKLSRSCSRTCRCLPSYLTTLAAAPLKNRKVPSPDARKWMHGRAGIRQVWVYVSAAAISNIPRKLAAQQEAAYPNADVPTTSIVMRPASQHGTHEASKACTAA